MTYAHRSLGDADFKLPRQLLTPEPDVVLGTLAPNSDRFVIYATDGLWDVVSRSQITPDHAQITPRSSQTYAYRSLPDQAQITHRSHFIVHTP